MSNREKRTLLQQQQQPKKQQQQQKRQSLFQTPSDIQFFGNQAI